MKKLVFIFFFFPIISFGQQDRIFRPLPFFSEFQTARMVGKQHLEVTAITSLIFQSEQSSTVSNTNITLEFHQNNAIMPTFGFISIYGLREKIDVRFRVAFLKPSDYFRGYLHYDDPVSFEFSCGAKFSLITNKLALNTDFSMQQQKADIFWFGTSTYRRVDFIPTLLYTYSFENKKNITLSVKHFQPLHQSSVFSDNGFDIDDNKALSFGSISCNTVFNIEDWRLIPEISLLHAYGQNDVIIVSPNIFPQQPGADDPIFADPGDPFITPFYFQIGIGVTKTF